MNVKYGRSGTESTVLLSCTLAFFVTAFGRLALSPLVPQITATFGLSNTAIGIALTGMWATYSATQFPSGLLADRYGERVIVLIAIAGTGVASLGVAFAPTYPVFVLGAVLLGAVGGLHYSAATTLLSRTHENIGMAIGIHNIGMPAGGVIAPAIASWVGIRYGWRPAALLVLGIAVPVLGLFALTVQPREPPASGESIRNRLNVEEIRPALSSPAAAFTVCLGVISMFVAIGLFTFVPAFLVEYSGYGPGIAGGLFAVFFLLLVPLQAAIGYVSDMFGRDLTLAGCFVACWGGILLLLFQSGLTSLVMSLVLVALGCSAVPVIDSRLVDQFSGTGVGMEFGLLRAIYGLVGGLGAGVVGVLADLFSWAVAFGFLAWISLLTALAVWLNGHLSLGY